MVTQEQIDRAKAAAVTTGYWLAAEAAVDAGDYPAYVKAWNKYIELAEELEKA